MLSPRLSDCVGCSDISALLSDIDCKLFAMSKDLYNNTILILNKSIDSEVIFDLLNYKRILTFKLCNVDYACHYSVEMIANRVKLLIHK